MEKLKEKEKRKRRDNLFKVEKKSTKGITLIALVITVIVIIILAGVSIDLVIGDNGIITVAKRARENMEIATQEEQIALDNLVLQLDDKASYNAEKSVNAPTILSGMTPIKFTMPTDESMGEVVKTNKNDTDWYEYGTTYETRRWANAQTQDGSMWVWIPRFAYKIDSANETIDVKFLIGTTDTYYKEDGSIGTAQRQKTVNEVIDTTKDYVVHPAFTNESSIGYANGGWDSELTGIWVAKFEAGYASGNNTATVKASNVKYSQASSYVQATESTTGKDATLVARNWLDGIYGKYENNTYSWLNGEVSIKYPTFQGTTYAMNYININDAYNIARALTDSGNIYGLNSANTNSHLMKNSEWGACAYLSKSQYGINTTEMTVNNANLLSGSTTRTETAGQNGVDSVYAVTGCTSNSTETGSVKTTIEDINNVEGNTSDVYGIYIWKQKNGQNASTTGTIYGIYDMSGGTWERTAGFTSNGNTNLLRYGKSVISEAGVSYTEEGTTLSVIANTGASTKYVSIYPHNSEYDNTGIANNDANLNTANQNNFVSNTKIYGDAVRETTGSTAGTSNDGWNTSSWNDDYSSFPGLHYPFFIRGGNLWNGSPAGSFAFGRTDGYSNYYYGFRAVLVSGAAL